LQDEPLSLEEIMNKLKDRDPMGKFNEIETRKALYEMLQDETVRLRRDKIYQLRTREAKE
jgi:hypothetical protein